MAAKNFSVVETDVLVVGAGGAGARAAIEAGKNAANVTIVCIGPADKSGSTGGTMGGVVSTEIPEDKHLQRVVEVEEYICDQDLVEVYVKEANTRYNELVEYCKGKKISRSQEMMAGLRAVVSKYPNIKVMGDSVITKLLTKGGKIVGATGLDMRSGEFIVFKAKAVILATGGWEDLYPYTTCYPQGVAGYGWAGAGQALAYDVGAELVEMEMMQFTVAAKEPPLAFAVRHYEVAGKRISFGYNLQYGPYVNAKGETILTREQVTALPCSTYSYKLPMRVMKEIADGKGPVYIQLPPVGEYDKVLKLGISDKEAIDGWREIGLDITKIEKVEHAFCAHCALGGIRINVMCETNVPGLYAAGEVAGNLYGASRAVGYFKDVHFPGMSALEIMVFGARAGKYAAEYAKKAKGAEPDLDEVEKEIDRINAFKKPKRNGISPLDVKKKLREIAGKYLFFPRNAKGLKAALKEIDQIRKRDLPRIQVADVERYNLELLDALEAMTLTATAELVAQSALFRTESRGCHQRDDCPKTDYENWTMHTLVKQEKGKMKVEKTPVVVTKLKPPTR